MTAFLGFPVGHEGAWHGARDLPIYLIAICAKKRASISEMNPEGGARRVSPARQEPRPPTLPPSHSSCYLRMRLCVKGSQAPFSLLLRTHCWMKSMPSRPSLTLG